MITAIITTTGIIITEMIVDIVIGTTVIKKVVCVVNSVSITRWVSQLVITSMCGLRPFSGLLSTAYLWFVFILVYLHFSPVFALCIHERVLFPPRKKN